MNRPLHWRTPDTATLLELLPR